MLGRSTIAPPKGDRRFADPAWVAHPFYRRLGQAYLTVERAIGDAVEDADIDWSTRERARFAAGILASGLAPTNTLVGNPTALKHAFDTGGASLVRGGRNLLGDIRHTRMPRQVDASPFTVGENVGATPGEVVFRNEVLEILQYTPTTPTVRTVPLLIVWSVINRHYILDLAKDRSFIEYAVGQGLQVFVTSWRNPTAEHADWDLDTYAQALLDATDAIREITGSEQIGTVGLCAGGQLLAAVMAHLQGARRGPDRARRVRGQPDRHVRPERRRARAAPRAARRRPARHRGHRGRRRPGDRGRVLLAAPDRAGLEPVGQQLPPGQGRAAVRHPRLEQRHDPRARRPAARPAADRDGQPARHPGRPDPARDPRGPRCRSPPTPTSWAPRPTTSSRGRAPTAPPQLFGGDSTFVLSGGGHIQHLVNPPGNPKAHFRTGPVAAQDADAWLDGSVQQAGSWWPHWADWAIARSGEEQPAPKKLGSRRHRPIEAAPGRYVMER